MRLRLSALILAPALAACGSGNDSPAGGTLPVTVANSEAVASAAFLAADGILEIGDSTNVFNASVPGETGARSRFDLTGFLESHVVGLLPSSVRQVVITTTEPCGSGHVVETWDDADDNGEVSTGDTLELTFVGCTDDQGVTVDGRVFIDGLVLTGDLANDSISVSLSMDFEELTVNDGAESIVFDGRITVSLTVLDDDWTFRYSMSASFTGSGTTIMAGTSISISVDTATGDFTFTSDGGVDVGALGNVVFTTTTPFGGNESQDYPSTGSMTIRGSGGSSLKLSAVDATQVRIEVDEDGDGVFETTVTTNWSNLDD